MMSTSYKYLDISIGCDKHPKAGAPHYMPHLLGDDPCRFLVYFTTKRRTTLLQSPMFHVSGVYQ